MTNLSQYETKLLMLLGRILTRDMRRRQEEAELAEERRSAALRKEYAALERAKRAANRAMLTGHHIQPPTLAEQQVASILSDFQNIAADFPSKQGRKRVIDEEATWQDEESAATKKAKIDEPKDSDRKSEGACETDPIPLKTDDNFVSIPELIIPSMNEGVANIPFRHHLSNSSNTATIMPADMMLCNIVDMCPTPLDEVIQTVRNFDHRYNIDSRLRQCEDPDFITSAVIGKNSTEIGKPSTAESI